MNGNAELYLRAVYAVIGSPSAPVRRLDRIEVIDPDENVVGELPVHEATVRSDASNISTLDLTTFRFMVTEE